jgi:hypothetical protein
MTLPPEIADLTPVPEPDAGGNDSLGVESPPPVVSPADETPSVTFEDLTLGQAVGQLFRSPGATFMALREILRRDEQPQFVLPVPVASLSDRRTTASPGFGLPSFSFKAAEVAPLTPDKLLVRPYQLAALFVRVVAFVVGLYGSNILAASRTSDDGLYTGTPWLIAAFLFWLVSEVVESWPRLTGKLPDNAPDSAGAVREMAEPMVSSTTRAIVAGLALLFSAGASLYNSNNTFTLFGVLCWVVSILLWVWVFAPAGWAIGRLWRNLRSYRLRPTWTLWAILFILVLATWFRFDRIVQVPPEMTSDHVEKILDAQNILNGIPQVFFPNNGGRDPLHFYLLAFSSALTGIPITFTYLKVASAIEGIISILLLWWMGREIFGQKERDLGNLVGLFLALLVTVSYWHESLSRLGLRIILTVCFTALLVLYLARAMRTNERGEFIKAGLVLGVSLYAYQVTRIFPLLVAMASGLLILFSGIRWLRDRSQSPYFVKTLLNSLILTVIVAAVFVPMATFIRQYPEDYLRRTTGRLLGDDLIQETDAAGNLVERVPTPEEQAEAFNRNLGILADNIRRALLMYNFNGDVAWINAASNRPAMDVITGTLLILGSAAWFARMIRRRDPVDWFIPLAFIVLIFPSALSIAYPIENPSATRMSGTLAIVYLVAAFPLALMARSLWQLLGRRGVVIAGATVVMLTGVAFSSNRETYFGDYYRGYLGSSLPYSEPGRTLRGFADSNGSFGNAFMIAYTYWWDHRAIGLEAGLYDWPNGVVSINQLPEMLFNGLNRTDRYALDPDKSLLFFVNRADTVTIDQLKTWFPLSYIQQVESYQPEDSYTLVWVPPLGEQGLYEMLQAAGYLQ